jgi:hypothetical protein
MSLAAASFRGYGQTHCIEMRSTMGEMRTTIDLPDDLHRRARSIARDTSRSLSATVADLMRRGLGEARPSAPRRSERTGLPVVRLGTTVTSEDLQALEDDEGASPQGGC